MNIKNKLSYHLQQSLGMIIIENPVSIFRNKFSTQAMDITDIESSLKYFNNDIYGNDVVIQFNTLIDEEKSKTHNNMVVSPWIALDIDVHSDKEKESFALDGGIERILNILKEDKHCLALGRSKGMKGIRAVYFINIQPSYHVSELDSTYIEFEKVKQQMKYMTLENHLYKLGLTHIADYNDTSFFKRYSQVTYPMGEIIKIRPLTEDMGINMDDITISLIVSSNKSKNIRINNSNNNNYKESPTINYKSLSELTQEERMSIHNKFSKNPIRYQGGEDFFRYKNANIETRIFLYELFKLYYGGGSRAPRVALDGGFDSFNEYIDNTMKTNSNSNQSSWLSFFKGIRIKDLVKNKK